MMTRDFAVKALTHTATCGHWYADGDPETGVCYAVVRRTGMFHGCFVVARDGTRRYRTLFDAATACQEAQRALDQRRQGQVS